MSPDLARTLAEIPPDLARSPRTGWTRAHWEATADVLLAAVRPHATPRHAQIRLPGPVSRFGRSSDGLEGFARSFLLAAFRLAGAGGVDPLGLADWYAEGLSAGVDPASPERWPGLLDIRQARVEAASIAIALHETRPWIWDRLQERTRELLVIWLADIVGTADYNNNWIWFQNIIEAFLRTVGGPWRPADIERNLALHESWYVGDGWYTDGGTRNFDYYNWWAMHYYPLWFDRILGGAAEPAPVPAYRDRLRRFLRDAPYLVGADGAPVLQGRSATYRWAMLAPYWAGALFEATPLEPGLTRRVASGVLRHFVDRGAVDGDGLLPVGWYAPFEAIRQPYTGAGSPYWASKGFAGLLLPPGHPAWQDEELPLPVERADTQRVLRGPGWIVSGTRADGVVRVLNHGAAHSRAAGADAPFYARHGYASHAAPGLPPLEAPDSHVGLLDGGGCSHRGLFALVDVEIEAAGGASVLASAGRATWPPAQGNDTTPAGPWVTTASVVRGPVEVRLVRVDPADEHATDATWRLHLGGWSLASDEAVTPAPATSGAAVRGDGGLISSVVPLLRLDESGVSESTGSNPLGRVSASPWARTTCPVRFGLIYAALVVLSGRQQTLEEAYGVRATTTAERVTIVWPDDAVTELRLPPPPDSRSRTDER